MPELVWLVTGCSSGFGAQFVPSIIARGDKVIATARKTDSFPQLKSAGASTLQLDVTDSPDRIQEVINQAIEIHGRIDVLVNNAGYIASGAWENVEVEALRRQFDTNVFGAFNVTRAILPHFRNRHTGTVVFVGSLSGWVGHPGVGAYAGSKFALAGMVEALKDEISPLGIRTLLIEPGRFRTMLLSQRNMKSATDNVAEYSDFTQNFAKSLAAEDRAQPGDPVKFVETVLDFVRREGWASDGDLPFRLPLGTDAYDEIKAKLEKNLKLLEDWKAIIQSTDHDQ